MAGQSDLAKALALRADESDGPGLFAVIVHRFHPHRFVEKRTGEHLTFPDGRNFIHLNISLN